MKFYADNSIFKVFLHDVGLLACLCGARSSEMLLGMGAFTEFKGAFTENYVMNQIKSMEDTDIIADEIFYYSKDNSPLEVDFVVQGGKRVIPTEVKAEENLQSKSLKAFHAENPGIRCVRTSMADYRKEEWMENVPLYASKSYVCELGKE